jgi:hypothetical protein
MNELKIDKDVLNFVQISLDLIETVHASYDVMQRASAETKDLGLRNELELACENMIIKTGVQINFVQEVLNRVKKES